MEPNRWVYVTLGKQAWAPQDLKNKMLKQPMNHWMIGSALKPWDVYNSWKNKHPNNWRRNQNTILGNNFEFNRHFDLN